MSFIKRKMMWQKKVLIMFIIVYSIIQFYLLAQLKHIPGPMYGGDLYAHHGFAINYIENGFWTDPFFKNEYAFYPWLGNYFFITIHWLTGVSLMIAMRYASILMNILSAIAFFLLAKQFFKDETFALMTSIFTVVSRGISHFAPNQLVWAVWIPLWYYFWLKSEEDNSLKNKFFTGVFMGFSALTQVAFFIGGLFPFLFTIIFNTLLTKQNMKNMIKKYWLILIVGGIISLPFYGVTIVKYDKTLNPLFQYNGSNIDSLGFNWWFKSSFGGFFSFNNLLNTLTSLLTFLGFVLLILNFKKSNFRILILIFIAGIITPLHFLITKPLFDKWILPGHLFGTGLVLVFLFMLGFNSLFKSLKINEKKTLFVFAALILLILSSQIKYYNTDRWVLFGKNLDSGTQAWLSVGDWIKKNTNINTVFLAGDESCFAMHGVSGRKCVIVRRTHANYFVDIDERMADASIIFFGNNTWLKKQLIKKYDIDYLLLDPFLQQTVIKVMPKYKKYLEENGVKFIEGRDRLDVAESDAKQFDLLLVIPPVKQPLSKDLDQLFIKSQDFGSKEFPIIIYKSFSE